LLLQRSILLLLLLLLLLRGRLQPRQHVGDTQYNVLNTICAGSVHKSCMMGLDELMILGLHFYQQRLLCG
jgi:hypothetical protein